MEKHILISAEGNYTYQAEQDNYTPVLDSLVLSKDTVINLYLNPTHASIKFRISDGNDPLYQAEVEIDEKTAMSNSVGISIFKDLTIGKSYPYSISKTGYLDLLDSLILQRDTTINASLSLATGFISRDKNHLNIFPNPAKEEIYVQSTESIGSLKLYDMKGILIRQMECLSSNCTLRLAGIEGGSYLLQIALENIESEVITEKINIL